MRVSEVWCLIKHTTVSADITDGQPLSSLRPSHIPGAGTAQGGPAIKGPDRLRPTTDRPVHPGFLPEGPLGIDASAHYAYFTYFRRSPAVILTMTLITPS